MAKIKNNPNKLFLIFVLILLTAVIFGYIGYEIGSAKNNKTPVTINDSFSIKSTPENYGIYENPVVGISIQYPSDFKIDANQGEVDNTSYYFAAEKYTLENYEKGRDGTFGSNELAVRIEMNKSNKKTLEEYVNQIKNGYGSNVTIVSETPITIGGVPAMKIVNHQSDFGGQNNENVYLLHNGYEISIAKAPYTTSLQIEFENIINSIKLNGGQ